MKYVFTLIILIFATTVQAQIEVKKSQEKFIVGNYKATGSELVGLIDEYKDTTYLLVFRNARYKTIFDFQMVGFKNEGNTLEVFYTLLKSVYLDENIKNKDYNVKFKLGGIDVSVSTVRISGITSAMFFTPKGYAMFSEKEIDKIFGK